MTTKEDIIITKENDGDAFNFFEESSDNSDVDVSRMKKQSSSNRRKQKRQVVRERHRPTVVSQTPTPSPAPSRPVSSLNDNMFEVFTNPDKTRVEESEDEYSMAPDTEPWTKQPDTFNDPEFSGSEGMGGGDDYDAEQPSPEFNTIEEEKQDLLYKFYRLTSKGIPVTRKFNMQSDVKEMRNEFNRIQRDNDVKSSIRFSRRMLMACVTGLEFMNKRYDPFDVKLDGWSESVMENIDDYDNVFERLHDKYASKVSMAPEIELLLSLAGSAFMFHLTNSMFNSLPNLKDIAKQNPDVLKNMMQSMSATMNSAAQQQEPAKKSTTNVQESNTPGGEREMKPPAMDMSSLFGMMQPMLTPPSVNNNGVSPVGNATFPVPSRTTDITTRLQPPQPPPKQVPPEFLKTESISSISSLSDAQSTREGEKIKNISFSDASHTIGGTKKKGRGKNKIISTNENTISI